MCVCIPLFNYDGSFTAFPFPRIAVSGEEEEEAKRCFLCEFEFLVVDWLVRGG